MRIIKSWAIPVAAVAALAVTSEAKPISAATTEPKHECADRFTPREFKSYVRAVYRRDRVSPKALRRLDKMRACSNPRKARYAMLRSQRHEGVLRHRRADPWGYEWSKISPGVKNRLAVLRGCETRGIPFPKNYQWRGHHHGAYQYDKATWAETGGSGYAYNASPREQDVRTAWFFPSHASRWQCKA